MIDSSNVPPANDDIDLGSLGAALWRAKGWIIGVSLLVGALTFIGLSMMRPLYMSEARILVQNEETAFTRPTSEQGNTTYRTVLDEQAVQSQVQVLTSRDLILQVVRDLDLTENAAFQRDAGASLVERILKMAGLGRYSPETQEERAANALAEHLDVYQLTKSSVIAVEYTSGDPHLAAKIANTLADVYINWQRDAKIGQTKDASAWLDAQIKALRKATAESEEAVGAFKASEGLYAGSNDVTLNAQQLSELNSQLILAEAQESEARARAELIKKMLSSNGDIDATPEVLNSQLVNNLIEQRVLVQRQLAELSATLLPSHPRIQQLRSELSDVRAQIRTEAQKVVKSLENQATIAAAREASLRKSLNAAKDRSAGQTDAEVKLRALEREAKANRDLLESYLARYRDASARHDIGAVPAQAAIVSRAHASVLPSFPRRGPITLLVVAATALLAIGSVLAKTIIVGAPSPRRASSKSYAPEELVPSEPEYMSEAEMMALSRMRAEGRKRRPKRGASSGMKTAGGSRPRAEAPPKPEKQRPPSPAPEGEPTTPEMPKPAVSSAADKSIPAKPAQAPRTAPTQKSVWRAAKPAKRPQWLSVNEPRSAEIDGPREPKPEATQTEKPSAETEPSQPVTTAAADTGSTSAASTSTESTSATSAGDEDRNAAQPEKQIEPTDTPNQAASKPSTGAIATLASLAATGTAIAAASERTDASTTEDEPARPAMADPEKAAAPNAPSESARDQVASAPKASEAAAEPEPAKEKPKPSSAAMELIQRMRQDVVGKDAPVVPSESATARAKGFLARMNSKRSNTASDAEPESPAAAPRAAQDAHQHVEKTESEMAALSPNDLRHYLTQRIATADTEDEWSATADPSASMGEIGPVSSSLDAIIDDIVARSTGGLPRAMLVAGTSARAQSPQAAIEIARNLADRNEQVALVDLAKGAAVVSGQLGMPRVPGFTDLASGAADFADVVKLDEGSTLQVIPAGNPTIDEGYREPDSFMQVFEALTQTYDCVVLHADVPAIESLMPALKFELPVAIAVLPPHASPEDEQESLSIVQRLGCPVVVYGSGGKQKRFSLFGRKVAV